MLEITLKGKKEEFKFSYRAFFRANNLFSTSDGANDGASNIWLGFVTNDDSALFNALRALLPTKYQDSDIFDLLDQVDEEGKVDEFAAQVEAELHKSGFFRRAAERWIKLTEKYSGDLKVTPEMSEEKKIQTKASKDTLAAMKKSLS